MAAAAAKKAIQVVLLDIGENSPDPFTVPVVFFFLLLCLRTGVACLPIVLAWTRWLM